MPDFAQSDFSNGLLISTAAGLVVAIFTMLFANLFRDHFKRQVAMIQEYGGQLEILYLEILYETTKRFCIHRRKPMYLPDEQDESFELNILPIIDVIFAIFTFFVVSTLFLTRSDSLPVNFSKAATVETQQQTRVTVTVNEGNDISLNREAIELNELQAGVRSLMDETQSTIVVINADKAVSHGQVIAVMDWLREVEEAVLGIATQPGSAPDSAQSD
ncbi:biopolymer transport protein [Rubidibacter lacunae KORDI 51-2]|uniref:Biopolymer transport protein n=1 Tax=Rubidibacter lacunae KORDI 51-2 TaxID=582515 RepID=U5DJ79_9CHRO|nr:biopolymer transporter ExbD [Rubidibacter lacunae]ERN40987.1 biopolymer transport protein [Rubidibacter lacunae KORDI 51-2]